MALKQKYAHVPIIAEADDSVDAEKHPWDDEHVTHPPPRRRLRLCHVFVFLCGLLVGIVGTAVSAPTINAVKQALERAHAKILYKEADDINEFYGLVEQPSASDPICGNDRHEAKANGCKYDLMASRWYPEECFHDDVLQQMLGEVEFDWYRDAAHTDLVPLELALSGDYDMLYPLYDFHIIHCLYARYQFRRLHMAVIEHRQIDDDVYSYTHTIHCTKLIMQWPTELRYGKNTTTISPSDVSYCIPPFL